MQRNTGATVPTWEQYRAAIRNEEWLAAMRLLEVEVFPTVRRDAEQWLAFPEVDGERDADGVWRPAPELDWEGWVADVDQRGRGWSSTEWRLFELVAGLTTGRPFNIVGVLDQMHSWEAAVWGVLVDWGTGGGAGRPGRLAVLPR